MYSLEEIWSCMQARLVSQKAILPHFQKLGEAEDTKRKPNMKKLQGLFKVL